MEKGFLKSSLFMLLAGSILYGAQTKTQISMLYVAILNRASEGEGNRYWQTSQPDMATTANVILNTDDAKAYFGTKLDTNQAFIEWIYKNTLNKTESDDPDGIAYVVLGTSAILIYTPTEVGTDIFLTLTVTDDGATSSDSIKIFV